MALLTKQQAADELAVSLSTVKRLITAGEIPVRHVRGAARIHPADLHAYVIRAGGGTPIEALTKRQMRAYHGKANDLAKLTGRPVAEVKAEALALVGREVASIKECTLDEASDVLDHLDEQLAARTAG